jgi:hypothetical protein
MFLVWCSLIQENALLAGKKMNYSCTKVVLLYHEEIFSFSVDKMLTIRAFNCYGILICSKNRIECGELLVDFAYCQIVILLSSSETRRH